MSTEVRPGGPGGPGGPEPHRAAPKRRGLVLGAGGLLGFTWTVGALHALERTLGIDVRDMDVVLGTSGGSVLAAVLGCGVPVEVVMRHQHGRVRSGDTDIDWN
nr:patatin-like phospholipase family protein [Geodermatophilaceae bacterium]